MMVIKKIGNRIIDTEYYSEKFGRVVMDITNVEQPPNKETTRYLIKFIRRMREKNDSV